MRERLLAAPFVRFLLVGGLNTLVGLTVTYVMLHAAGLSYWGATFAGNAVGAVVSYTLNRKFTFRSSRPVPQTFALFVGVIVACYFVSFYAGLQISRLLVGTLPDRLRYDSLVKDAAVIVSTGIYTLTNFAGQKLLVFRETRPSS